jgi:hypothetical protein|tara:strand:- start:1950 stop:2216 length:267 start_codon:yes stop_codon:yes gene_type:complete
MSNLNQLIEDCQYTMEDVESIVTSTARSWTDEKKIDTLLHIDAGLCSQQGCDSTKGEIRHMKAQQKIIYKGIRQIDKTLGDTLLRYAG